MKYLVDTDWLIDVLSCIASALSTIERLSSDGIGISIITFGELYEDAVLSPDPQTALQRYREFLAAFPALPLTGPVMHRFATTRAIPALAPARCRQPRTKLVVDGRPTGDHPWRNGYRPLPLRAQRSPKNIRGRHPLPARLLDNSSICATLASTMREG
jgi:hypothetical protein